MAADEKRPARRHLRSPDTPPGNEPPGNEPPGNEPPGNEPPGNEPSRNEPPGNEPSRNEPSRNEPLRNLAASVRHRLTQIARHNGEDFHLVLTRYGLERLLYRLARSPHGEAFVLKGACLFQLWSNHPHRPTRDLDLLGRGEASVEQFESIFRQVCDHPVAADGLEFLADRVRGESIKDEDQYQGIRLRIDARLANARLPLQVDIGFGDAITPGPIDIEYPTLLDFPSPLMRAYPRETVVAEKFQAMVTLGMANSRMKDFFDLWTLAREYAFDGMSLCAALRATFARRETLLPATPPLALTSVFAFDKPKQTQWRAFLRKGKLASDPIELPEVIGVLDPFLMPPMQALSAGRPFARRWLPGGPWQA